MKLPQNGRKTGRIRLALLMETICSTGIRVSEVKYVTVEARKSEKSRGFYERKNTHNSVFIQTLQKASEICKEDGGLEPGPFCHLGRTAYRQKTDLGRNEDAVQGGRGK